MYKGENGLIFDDDPHILKAVHFNQVVMVNSLSHSPLDLHPVDLWKTDTNHSLQNTLHTVDYQGQNTLQQGEELALFDGHLVQLQKYINPIHSKYISIYILIIIQICSTFYILTKLLFILYIYLYTKIYSPFISPESIF